MGANCCKTRAKGISPSFKTSLKKDGYDDAPTPFVPEKGFYQPSTEETDDATTPFVPEKGFYQPSTEETHEAYQALLSIIDHQLGLRSQYVSCVAAEEILSVMKSVVNPITQKAEIEKVLNPMDSETFKQLVLIAGVITDYSQVPPPVEKGFYQPRSEDTWSAYRLLLKVMESEICFKQSLIDRCKEAHEILLILKDENMEVERKMYQVENHLGTISRDTFELLVEYAALLWDFDDFKAHASHVLSDCGRDRWSDDQENPMGWSWDSLEEDEEVEDDPVSNQEVVDEHGCVDRY